mgnify:CR=1 FL=1
MNEEFEIELNNDENINDIEIQDNAENVEINAEETEQEIDVEIINDDDRLGEIVAQIIELSAVTNLKAFDGPATKNGERNRDTSSYSFNGKVYRKKYSVSFGTDLY